MSCPGDAPDGPLLVSDRLFGQIWEIVGRVIWGLKSGLSGPDGLFQLGSGGRSWGSQLWGET